jgi:hypothetical protein
MKLQNFGSNQNIVEISDDLTVFFSYNTPVACFKRSETTGKFEVFRTAQFWSRTTSKHINNWLSSLNFSSRATEKPQEFFNNLIK